jgi:hypothetical protein
MHRGVNCYAGFFGKKADGILTVKSTKNSKFSVKTPLAFGLRSKINRINRFRHLVLILLVSLIVTPLGPSNRNSVPWAPNKNHLTIWPPYFHHRSVDQGSYVDSKIIFLSKFSLCV